MPAGKTPKKSQNKQYKTLLMKSQGLHHVNVLFTKVWVFVIISLTIKASNDNDSGYYQSIGKRGDRFLFGIIGNFGPWELLFILLIVLIIVGPGKLPQVGQSLGKALQNFRKAREDDFDELEEKKD